METVFHSELWRDLYVMLGTSAGALVGLLFVVMSLHLEKVDNPASNLRMIIEGARNNTYHLLNVLVMATLVLMPQSLPMLGAELLAINLFGLRLPLIRTYKYCIKPVTVTSRSDFPYVLILTIITGYVLGILGGAALIRNEEWGLYPVTLCCITLIVRSVLTAWKFMFGPKHAAAAAKEN